MIDRQTAERFHNKYVKVVFSDSGRDIFTRGRVIEVSDFCLILKYPDGEESISLERVLFIKEVFSNE